MSLPSRRSDDSIGLNYRPHQTDDEVEFLGIVSPIGHQELSPQDIVDPQPHQKRTRASGQGNLVNFHFCENCRIWKRGRLEYNWGRQICYLCYANFYTQRETPKNQSTTEDDLFNKPKCGICEDEKQDIIMMPCAHWIGPACVAQIEDCPFCRTPIQWAFESAPQWSIKDQSSSSSSSLSYLSWIKIFSLRYLSSLICCFPHRSCLHDRVLWDYVNLLGRRKRVARFSSEAVRICWHLASISTTVSIKKIHYP